MRQNWIAQYVVCCMRSEEDKENKEEKEQRRKRIKMLIDIKYVHLNQSNSTK